MFGPVYAEHVSVSCLGRGRGLFVASFGTWRWRGGCAGRHARVRARASGSVRGFQLTFKGGDSGFKLTDFVIPLGTHILDQFTDPLPRVKRGFECIGGMLGCREMAREFVRRD